MKLAVVALAVLPGISGCFTQATGGVTYARDGVTGGEAELTVGDAAVREFADIALHAVARDDGSSTAAFALDEGLRGSVMGAISEEADWARWVDFGGDLGFGLGAYGALHGMARAFVGGWADIRLDKDHAHYPTLRVQLRQIAYTAGVADETQLLVGFGMTAREHPHWIH